MTRRLRTVLLGLLLAPLACMEPYSAREEVELIVLESLTGCQQWFGPDVTPCLEVIELPGKVRRPFAENIEGFRYVRGVRQHIVVARYTLNNPPADASSYEYRLLRIVSRKQVYIALEIPDP
jgi:hypothetical protein